MISDFVEVPSTAKSLCARRPLHGAGLNDAPYMVFLTKNRKIIGMCPFYGAWSNMINRCYGVAFQEKQPTYIGCTVCPDWLLFTNFKSWMIKQNWKGMCLDKDLKIFGNKEYNPEACEFVSNDLNVLLTNTAKAKGEWPLGVSFCKQTKKFTSSCRVENKLVSLGCFTTPELAHDAYMEFKINRIKYFIQEYPVLKHGLEDAIKSLQKEIL